MKISVIVTNYNGISLLKKNFLHIINSSTIADEIILADDNSTDSSVKFIQELTNKNKKIKIIRQESNVGFGSNSNNAIKSAKGDLVVLLNNDIKPHPNYIENSIKHFQNKEIFAVGFSELNNENWAKIFWENGYIQHLPGSPVDKSHITGWVSGGSGVFRKSIFEKLGGFDSIYYPFYCEDLDIGYRAWKSGYKLLWEPSSIVEHRHESTMSKFPKHFRNYVIERNRLLVVWRNIEDKKMLFENKLNLFSRIMFGPNYVKIIRAAKNQIDKHPKPIVYPKLSDQQIFELFK